MLTILFVLPTIVGPTRGGVSRVTFLLSEILKQRGIEVLFLINKPSEYYDTIKNNISIYKYPSADYMSPQNVKFYHEFLNEHKVDIIINQWGLFEESRLYLNIGSNNCKIISVLHSNPMLNYDYLASEELILKDKSFIGFLKLVVRTLIYPKIKRSYLNSRVCHLRYILNNSDRVVLLSSSHKDILRKYDIEYLDSKIAIIPNPLSFDVQYCKKKKQMLYVGRLEQGEKRPDRLLKIWDRLYKKYPDWEMIIVGDGKERERLERQAKELERISFVGFQPSEKYYRDASIFCLTSNLEGFPMVLPEAMAFGTVPLAFNSFPAIHDIIKNGETGFIIPPFSISEYVNKLELLINDENRRLQMSQACMRDVGRFSLEYIVEKWEDIFFSLAK